VFAIVWIDCVPKRIETFEVDVGITGKFGFTVAVFVVAFHDVIVPE